MIWNIKCLYVHNSATEFYRNKLSQKKRTVVECKALSVVSQDVGCSA
jgi:hypothetical protein